MNKFEISKIAKIPTKEGDFNMQVFKLGDKEHSVIFSDNMPKKPIVRVHSECFTGEVLGSLKCDCAYELKVALKEIKQNGGMIVYLRQEGRGIGLLNKINAYNLQEQGHDTVDANIHLGFKDDQREYEVAKDILRFFNIKSFILLTNSPQKAKALEGDFDIEVKNIKIRSNKFNKGYLQVKREKFNHTINEIKV